MLIKIRQKASGWMAWAIVGLISIPFALWGINSYFEGLNRVTVAVVNGDEIDYNAYQRTLSERRRALSQSLGRNVGAEFFNSAMFRESVLEELITDTLLRSEVESQGFRIGDEELGGVIRQTPMFEVDGRFDPARYDAVLRSAGYTPTTYEALQRRELALAQLEGRFSDTVFTVDEELNDLGRLVRQERDADYAVIPLERFLDEITVSEDDIADEYGANKDRYQAPPRMRVSYVELSVDEMAADIDLAETDLRAVYDENRARYQTPGERRASHILLQLPEGASPEDERDVQERAAALAERARAGEDFGTLAREHSEDAGSAATGGDLGVITAGAMVKPFEDAVYRLQEGEVSDPVRTRFGYHVVKLTRLAPDRERSFDSVRNEIHDAERRRRAEERFVELAEEFRNLVYEHPEDLAPVAEALELEVRESDWFTATAGSDIASFPAVRAQAFSDDVLQAGLNSESLEIGVDRLVALRALEHESARQRRMDEVRDQIIDEIKARRAAERVGELAQSLLRELEAGSDWDTLVSGAGLDGASLVLPGGESEDPVTRNVAALVYRAPAPTGGSPVFGGERLPDGGYALFRLTSVRDGDLESFEPAERDRLEQALTNRWGAGAFLAYVSELKNAADITRNTEVLASEEF